MKLFLYILLFFCVPSVHAQAEQKIPEKALASYFKARDYAARTQWEEGIDELKKAIKIYPEFTAAKALMAEFYYSLRQYDDAIAILEACDSASDFPPHSLFFLSELYLRKGNGVKAREFAERYLAQAKVNPKAQIKAEQTIRNAIFAEDAKKHPVPFTPKNLGPNINSSNWEYFPYLTPDGKLLAFTRLIHNQEDLYIAKRTKDGFSLAEPFGDNINSEQDNEGAETMNADGNLLFFTACNRFDGLGSCDIYFSQMVNGHWSDPQGIGKPVNSGSWEAQPSFSSDGRSLYFASNRPGGLGGKDIWVSYLSDNMQWSEPQNLGPSINTIYDDQCPFIHADNQTLYFTSNGWPSIGSGDIFVSRKTDTGWTKPVNLGYPINTENDDNGLTVSYDGKMAFLASNRENGLGGLDIYAFELPENVKPQKVTYVRGTVRDAKTKQPISAGYSLVDLDTRKEVYKGDSKNGSFFVSIIADKNYMLEVQKEKYLFYSQNINLKESSQLHPYEQVITLEPIEVNSKMILNNVFFDFDKSDLDSISGLELDKVADLLQKNPTIRIEISGHTDNKGDDKYNLSLSQRRAESVVAYLLQKGIERSRMVAKGYGETQPVAPNDTDENRARNRRTELKII